MATIANVNSKGGCGKTTLSILLATELARQGYKVALADTDPNGDVTEFAAVAKGKYPHLTILPGLTEDTITRSIVAERANHDIVLIDTAGFASSVGSKAIGLANMVLVPAMKSMPDVRHARRTIEYVDEQESIYAPRKWAKFLVWSKLAHQIESKPDRKVREAAEKLQTPILKHGIMDYASMRDMHISGRVPYEIDPTSKAAISVTEITNEVLQRLSEMA